MNLRTRLTITFFGLAIFPILAQGVILGGIGFQLQQRRALELEQHAATRISKEVEAFMRETEAELQSVLFVHGLRQLPEEQQEQVLHELLYFSEPIRRLALLDAQGREKIALSQVEIILPETKTSRTLQMEFLAPMRTGLPYYSPVRFNTPTGEPILTLAVPVMDPRSGLPDGVLVAEVKLRPIWRLIADFPAGVGEVVFIIDAKGRVIAHANPSIVLRGTVFELPGKEGIAPGLDGNLAIFATKEVRLGDQTQTIVAQRSLPDALNLTVATVFITGGLIVLSLALAAGLAFVVVRRLLLPVEDLAAVSDDIAAGDLTRRAQPVHADEIGRLAEAFNAMADRLQALIGSLEREVAERKHAEETVRRLNDELELRVRDRTRQLEAANQEMEAFSYSVSHDLRAPLRAIDGFTRILMEDHLEALGEEGMTLGDRISKNARRMAQLIDDLLSLSRLGRKELSRTQVDMGAMAASVFEELAVGVASRLEFRLSDLPPCIGDPALLWHVWANLLENALKFSGHRELIVIEVNAVKKETEIVYSVCDNGVGFDMQYVEKLFGVFQRLHDVTDFEGTGVGLAIVKRVIVRHGGRVWAESEPGRGATFYFLIPAEPDTP